MGHLVRGTHLGAVFENIGEGGDGHRGRSSRRGPVGRRGRGNHKPEWVEQVRSGEYKRWIQQHYGEGSEAP